MHIICIVKITNATPCLRTHRLVSPVGRLLRLICPLRRKQLTLMSRMLEDNHLRLGAHFVRNSFFLSRGRCALSPTRPEMKASVPVPHNNGYSSSPTSLCVPDSATTIHAVSRISPGLVWCCGLLKTQNVSSRRSTRV